MHTRTHTVDCALAPQPPPFFGERPKRSRRLMHRNLTPIRKQVLYGHVYTQPYVVNAIGSASRPSPGPPFSSTGAGAGAGGFGGDGDAGGGGGNGSCAGSGPVACGTALPHFVMPPAVAESVSRVAFFRCWSCAFNGGFPQPTCHTTPPPSLKTRGSFAWNLYAEIRS